MHVIIHYGAAHDDLVLLDKRLKERGLTIHLDEMKPSKRGRILKAVSDDFLKGRASFPSTKAVAA